MYWPSSTSDTSGEVDDEEAHLVLGATVQRLVDDLCDAAHDLRLQLEEDVELPGLDVVYQGGGKGGADFRNLKLFELHLTLKKYKKYYSEW